MAGGATELLRLIQESWAKVREGLERDPAELEWRLVQRGGAAAAHPPRAWCLAVRANDRRIDKGSALITPTDAADDDVRYPHTVRLDEPLLRRLCAPVWIEPPGEPVRVVARKVGSRPDALVMGRIKGRIRAHYLQRGAASGGKRLALIYCDGPLDPCAKGFVSCDPLWNLTGEFLPDLLPEGFEQEVQRVPVVAPPPRRIDLIERGPSRRLPPPPPDYVWYKWKDGVYVETAHEKWLAANRERWREYKRRHRKPSKSSGSLRHQGWRFVCPSCKRQVRMLYLPLPGLGVKLLSIPSLKGQVLRLRAQVAEPLPTFACGKCHGVMFVALTDPRKWQLFISYITCGLLHGREVPRPDWLPVVRKRKYAPHVNRAAPRRQEVLRRLLAGEKVGNIAVEMGMRVKQVRANVRKLCRQERVKDRWELASKLGGAAQPENRRQRVAECRERVKALMLEGLMNKEIAARLGVSMGVVAHHLHWLYRREGVANRRARAEAAKAVASPGLPGGSQSPPACPTRA